MNENSEESYILLVNWYLYSIMNKVFIPIYYLFPF